MSDEVLCEWCGTPAVLVQLAEHSVTAWRCPNPDCQAPRPHIWGPPPSRLESWRADVWNWYTIRKRKLIRSTVCALRGHRVKTIPPDDLVWDERTVCSRCWQELGPPA